MELDRIIVTGAREHNLKNLRVEIPKKKLVVFTGVSGSGKSSLAFDTLYAEGQRRYVESLSAYARQFLGQMEKPKYDAIRGLSPTIAIEQKAASKNPRSTVGTITEIHDYLRVLYARVGTQYCHRCDQPVDRQSAEEITREILTLEEGTKFILLAPLVQNRKGEHKQLIEATRREGFARIRIDGEVYGLDRIPELDKNRRHTLEAVVDRLKIKDGLFERLNDSVETALRFSDGRVVVWNPETDETRMYSEHRACADCGIGYPELTPQLFSFNSPLGACEGCNGLGTRKEVDPDLIVPDPDLSIAEGAIAPWGLLRDLRSSWLHAHLEALSDAIGLDVDIPWSDLPDEHRDAILYGIDEPILVEWRGRRRKGSFERNWDGLVANLNRKLERHTSKKKMSGLLRYFSQRDCHECDGGRLKPEPAAVRIAGKSIVDVCRKTIQDCHAFFDTIELGGSRGVIAEEVLKEIRNRLRFLLDVGLGYLTLDRLGPTLSGGESQRIRLASQIGSELTGVIYILDEPSIGLHQRDNKRLLRTLTHLRDIGNSVLVVEHDRETMEEADHILDFGPGAGVEGGRVVFNGSPDDLREADTLTGDYLAGRREIPKRKKRREPDGRWLEVIGAAENNLREIDVRFPVGCFTCVTGVSGAGKSSLVNAILYPALARAIHRSTQGVGTHQRIVGLQHIDKVIEIDQSPIGRTPRSNPATYTKVFDHIRKLFAKLPESRARGYKKGRFSFNVKGGRCGVCSGDGVIRIEMHFLADVFVPCEACDGARYNEATLQIRYRGKTIADVLEMTVHEALELFRDIPKICRILKTLRDVGLDYLPLGQPAPTLSGGEAQRVKLSKELCRRSTGNTLYILDEPTTGLHFHDVAKLIRVLNRLVDNGNTVIVIEHNLDVIACADWIIDLGPEGGDGGGRIVTTGTPEEVAGDQSSHTGRFLAELLEIEPERMASS